MREASPGQIARAPDSFAETIALSSGERFVFRPLKQEDASLLADYFLGLSADTRQRFGPHAFTAEQAAILCAQIDYGKIIRLLAVTGNVQEPRAAAYFILGLELHEEDEKRYRARGMELDRASVCSIAPSVADRFQGRGLGARVMARALALARALGRRNVILQGGVQATNSRAIQFYEKFGFGRVGSFSTTVENYDMMLNLTQKERSMRKSLRVILTDAGEPLAREAARLLERELRERAGVEVVHGAESPDVTLGIEPGIAAEGYRISQASGTVGIAGGDPAGLLYGVGRFLRESILRVGGVVPFAGTIESAPDCKTRGMYFAHNFHNWYRSAPMSDLVRYVEDLALWGLNAIAFACDTNPQCPVDEIENVMLPKQLEFTRAAKRCGIRLGMLTVANTILTPPDPVFAATPVPDANPARRGNIGHRVCPSTAEGFSRLSARFEKSLAAYAGVGLDFVVAFPYDEGGCGCERCRPWGANGYVKACKELSRLAKAKYPGCRFIAGTWCFDVLSEPEGEYEGLDRSIRAGAGWCDMTMCDSHFDFPEWPLKHGPIGGVPMVNFPEISMWGRYPWGGYGANPFPRRIAGIWQPARHLLDGGFPYSEGRFEDINKIMCLSMFWEKAADWQEVVRRYVRYYFGEAVVNEVSQAVQMMEDVYPRKLLTREKAAGVLERIEQADAKLPARVRESWRWRLLYLRAVIDMEAASHPDQKGVVSERQDECFRELTRLCCAENAGSPVKPPRRAPQP